MASSSSSEPEPALRLPSGAEVPFNDCAVRCGLAVVIGGGYGIVRGMVGGALERPVHGHKILTARQRFTQYAARSMSTERVQSTKYFAAMAALFSGTHCVLEKARGKKDSLNTGIAACASGGIMLGGAGPRAACMGCATFAAIAAILDKIFDLN